MKIQTKKKWGGGSGWGCEQRIEVFVKIQKNILFFFGGGGVGMSGSGSGVFKFLGKFTQKKFRGGGGGEYNIQTAFIKKKSY